MQLHHSDPLLSAARSGQIDRLKELLAKDNSISQEKLTDISTAAARTEQVGVLDVLVNRGWAVNPTEPDQPFLLPQALRSNKTELLRWLLDHGADPNISNSDQRGLSDQQGVAPITTAAKYCPLDTLKELINRGGNIERSEALSAAATSRIEDRVEKLTFLLEIGLDINRVEANLPEHTSTGHRASSGTALHAACKWGFDDSETFLLEHGADLNLLNSEGQSIEELKSRTKSLAARGWSIGHVSLAARQRISEERRKEKEQEGAAAAAAAAIATATQD